MTVSERRELTEVLLDSAERLSFDPGKSEITESESDRRRYHGMTPEWSPLFGTRTWLSMSEAERVRLTRSEVAQFLGVGIWLEVGLQVALLRAHHEADPARSDVRFLFTECADENRHSLMFVNAIEGIGSHFYPRDRLAVLLGWLFRTFAFGEVAYGIILAGEEVFDVMQRDWMDSDDVAGEIRRVAYIHVVEESRHMAFARDQIRCHMVGASRLRRTLSAFGIAAGTHIIAKTLINRRVYEERGLDWRTVKSDIDGNEFHRMMFRRGFGPFIEFLSREGLLTPSARWIYRKSNLL